MSTIQVGLVILTIICFISGIWPIGIAILGLLVYVSKTQKPQNKSTKRTIQDLEKENEILRQELADQAVRRAMDKAEQRKTKEEEK